MFALSDVMSEPFDEKLRCAHATASPGHCSPPPGHFPSHPIYRLTHTFTLSRTLRSRTVSLPFPAYCVSCASPSWSALLRLLCLALITLDVMFFRRFSTIPPFSTP
jgi:hypothetical protein